MKYLVYELFSGVGLCNQLFSFETAIYLAHIMKRKLILIIKNPLCHCGRSSWEYGYFLNFFTNEYEKYLPNGFEVYYRDIPKELVPHLRTNKTLETDKFSNIVFVDHDLITNGNQQIIKEFCHYRKPVNFNLNEFTDVYIHVTKSNASRCLYNFMTTKENYQLMYDICNSIKFKPIYYKIANQIYSELPKGKNDFVIFSHLRFGDVHKDKAFLERSNSLIIKNLSEYFEGHRTNLIQQKIYCLVDNKNNKPFFDAMKKYNIQHIDQYSDNKLKNYLQDNQMVYHENYEVTKYEVSNAIIDMILASLADEFLGYVSSTFSHYIQYLRFREHKSYYNYCNLVHNNSSFCRLRQVKQSDYEWIRLGFSGGHPCSWHYFFKPPVYRPPTYFTIHNKIDGFGSQLQACFSLVAYCHYKEYTYVHNPFYKMHHNDENLANFPKIMNDFMNLEHVYQDINTMSNHEKSQVHRVKEGYFVHGSLHPEFFYNKEVLEKLRTCYNSNPKPNIENIYKPNTYNIALHIRRGDVAQTNRHSSRFTHNVEYINIVGSLTLPENSVIHVFSEGSIDDFQDIKTAFPDTIFHLNTNIQETFHCMVKADMLIISKSSFCYCAALLNENKVIGTLIKSWWHKPLKSWL